MLIKDTFDSVPTEAIMNAFPKALFEPEDDHSSDFESGIDMLNSNFVDMEINGNL